MSQTMSRPSGTQRVAPLRKRPRQLPFPLNLYQTAVGKKWVMAVTGLGLIGFVIAHMVGNLKVYLGPEEINQYGEALRDLGGHLIPRTYALWALRIGLIVMFALHIHAAVTLSAMSNRANKAYPGGRDYIAANYASRTMRWTGPIILLYLFYHLADLTWGWWLGDDFVRGDPYHNLSESLASLPVAIIYVVANVALAVHLFHGTWSMFQSLGLNNPRWNSLRRGAAAGVAGLILVGNLSFPILAQAGVIDEDNRTSIPGASEAEEAQP